MKASPAKPSVVLAFTAGLEGGGAEKHLTRLVNSLDRRRFHPVVALATRGGKYESLLADDVNVVEVGSLRWWGSSTARMLASLPGLRRLIDELDPSIVFSVMDHANLVATIATVRSRRSPALCLSVQNPPTIEYGNTLHPVKRTIRWSIPRLYPHADSIVCISEGLAGDLRKLLDPVTARRVEVIHNAGLDPATDTRRGQPLTTDIHRTKDPLIVACGRLVKQKGFFVLLEAMRRLLDRRTCQLWILGEGPLRDALIRRRDELGLESAVSFVGFKDDPHTYFTEADVFVLSSLWEGFGNVIVEAMACGTPVVSTNCPYGPAEIISDGEDGVLVPVGDPEALADAIERVLEDDLLRARIARKGHIRARHFRPEAVAREHERLFARLCAGPLVR